MATSIETKYIPPSGTRGARIKATTMSDKKLFIYVSWHIDINMPELDSVAAKHVYAMKQLCDKLNWQGVYAMGDTGQGKVFVKLPFASIADSPAGPNKCRVICDRADVIDTRKVQPVECA